MFRKHTQDTRRCIIFCGFPIQNNIHYLNPLTTHYFVSILRVTIRFQKRKRGRALPQSLDYSRLRTCEGDCLIPFRGLRGIMQRSYLTQQQGSFTSNDQTQFSAASSLKSALSWLMVEGGRGGLHLQRGNFYRARGSLPPPHPPPPPIFFFNIHFVGFLCYDLRSNGKAACLQPQRWGAGGGSQPCMHLR